MNRRTIRRSIIGLLLAAAAFNPSTTSAQDRSKATVGLRGGYHTQNESAIAGIFFQYRFSSHFRLSPNIDYVFRHNLTDGCSINLDAHVPFNFAGYRAGVYPLAGLNYSIWSTRTDDISSERASRQTSRQSAFGFNVGGGFEWHATSSLKIMAEGKYCRVKHHNTAVVTLGIGYEF